MVAEIRTRFGCLLAVMMIIDSSHPSSICLTAYSLFTFAVSKRAPGDNRPNFVFFFPDETRAESLGTYGHPITQTPNYDRYMHVLGHRTQTHLIQPWEPNLFRYLKLAGYYNVMFGKNDAFAQDTFNTSLSYWESLIGVTMGNNAYAFNETGYFSFLSDEGASFGNDSAANGDYMAVIKGIDFMMNDPPEPFMLFLPGMGAHPQYGAPKDYQNLYNPAEIEKIAPLRPVDPPNKPRYYSPEDGIIAYRNLTDLPDETFYDINAVYLGRITYTDWIFGQLLDGIDAAGMTDSTAVFMSSDHGDFAGDSHLVEKWPGGLDDMLTHVPFMARIPGGTPNHTVAEPIQLFDILPTILELANITLNHTQFGVSLVEQLYGAPGNPNRTVFSEGGYYWPNEIEANDPYFVNQVNDPTNMYYPRYQEELSDYPNGSPRCTMMRNMQFKLVYRPLDVSELYDVEADPRELNNLYGNSTYASVQTDMLMQLLEWLFLTSDVTPLQEDTRNLAPLPGPAPCVAWPDPPNPTPQPGVEEL